MLFTQTMVSLRYYFLALSMLLIGIPHGAIDHIISSRLYDLKGSISDQLKFYIPYLLLMFLMALVWILSGIAGFILFVIITIYHFGQADIEHLDLPDSSKRVLTISRGLMILSLVIFVDFNYTLPVIGEATGVALQEIEWLYNNSYLLAILLGLQHPFLMSFLTYQNKERFELSWWYPVLDSIVILFLFLFNDPIIGFSLYFALWHSMGHFLEMKDFFNKMGESLSVWKFYKLALPFSSISLFGLAFIYLINNSFGLEEKMVSLLFILISVLTLPHVLVVEKMLKTKR
ncbi:beta-carotene 15,15'-dioxygenase, Brp/Blh family [Balneolaceae bacterium YR4-1]|uniref:Probable beta-carotene 15,15'-dioxygenase n=1 Tax=Halalkalibaculum roseum TaxID=2709311 RepID=A0A6M1T7G6_9BACT|nr:Brp/Blh family beta-carotene 15,15'-dioxygenase [Halalkalibaculum roseum]NGP76183.1 beta-carotene 15,15'-dioxygenase, Brp/Blh family [Halalkalibaculum roseum]